ncbi:hypothetical protein DCAR_0208065 [Daucus carota subsp. sativus]|uniref:Uncharacterized protein n=1 Tax=Daucus carota subsp. sativus TaxID=79200 RepID=A0A161XH29_DAUCS|nr:PREDICTED: uncharacterized protein LOC108208055 [Daucus carota subsp. sativus]WOG88830.1 hypothetical protein DCAR_0208065 [Daucus carota subsp. sativus]
MAGTLAKRHREEEGIDIQDFDENREAKLHKSYNNTENKQHALVSFLEQEEEETVVSSQDLSLFFSTLQQELFSDPHGDHQTLLVDPSTEDWNPCSYSVAEKEDSIGDDDKESVIRHLLEASDDELGLPNDAGVDRTARSGTSDEDCNGVDDDCKQSSSLFCDGLWELEDEAANYYTLLQSQLFM